MDLTQAADFCCRCCFHCDIINIDSILFGKKERQRELASFLLGLSVEKVSTASVRPVLFGNKENDFACLCDDIFYVLSEEQSSVSPNIPYRMLEYVTAGLRAMVDSEQLLYGRTRVYFPVPKLYMLQAGLETKEGGDLPGRFVSYDNDMRNYALVANGITYMQRTGGDAGYAVPENISTVAEYLGLMLERGIFVDLLSDKEVCDMTMAQFSRDDILIYQGREEGIKAFILDKVEDGVAETIIVKKLQKHFALDEQTARKYCRIYAK